MRIAPMRAAAVSFSVLTLAFLPQGQTVVVSSASLLQQSTVSRSPWLGPNALGTFVRKFVDGRTVCLEPSTEQARSIKERDPNLPLSVLVSDSDRSGAQQTVLRIILRGTNQLRTSPMAIKAFKRAASRWEALIQS